MKRTNPFLILKGMALLKWCTRKEAVDKIMKEINFKTAEREMRATNFATPGCWCALLAYGTDKVVALALPKEELSGREALEFFKWLFRMVGKIEGIPYAEVEKGDEADSFSDEVVKKIKATAKKVEDEEEQSELDKMILKELSKLIKNKMGGEVTGEPASGHVGMLEFDGEKLKVVAGDAPDAKEMEIISKAFSEMAKALKPEAKEDKPRFRFDVDPPKGDHLN